MLGITEHNRKWWTLGAMSFALFMIMLDNTVVNVALPSIQRDLETSLSALEWTINAYTLSFAVLLVAGGRLADIFGRRRGFLLGVVVFALSSAGVGLAPTDSWLIIGRVAQGVGAAFMMPATLSIITNAFPPSERGKAIGTWAGVSAMALALGPVVGGFFTEYVSWRAIFYINVPVATAAVAITLATTRESRDPTVERTVDIAGLVTISGGLTALVLALIEANKWGWGSPAIVGLLLGAVVLLTLFAVTELKIRVPLVDFDFFRSITFFGANVVAFIVTFGMLGMFFFLAIYMQNILGYTPLEAGVRFLPSTGMIILFAPIAGRLSDRIGSRPLITTGLLLAALALYMQSRVTVSTTYGDLLPAFMIMGVGIALVMSPMSAAALNAVSEAKSGVAAGILSMSRMVGGTFGVAVLGALFQQLGHEKLTNLLAETTGVSPAQANQLENLVGTGEARQVLSQFNPQTAEQIAAALRESFIYSLSYALRLAAVVAVAGALLALVLIRRTTSVPLPEDAGVKEAAQAMDTASAVETEPAPATTSE